LLIRKQNFLPCEACIDLSQGHRPARAIFCSFWLQMGIKLHEWWVYTTSWKN